MAKHLALESLPSSHYSQTPGCLEAMATRFIPQSHLWLSGTITLVHTTVTPLAAWSNGPQFIPQSHP